MFTFFSTLLSFARLAPFPPVNSLSWQLVKLNGTTSLVLAYADVVTSEKSILLDFPEYLRKNEIQGVELWQATPVLSE